MTQHYNDKNIINKDIFKTYSEYLTRKNFINIIRFEKDTKKYINDNNIKKNNNPFVLNNNNNISNITNYNFRKNILRCNRFKCYLNNI